METLNCGISSMSLWLYKDGAKKPKIARSDANCDVFDNVEIDGTAESSIGRMKHIEYSKKHIVKIRHGKKKGETLITRPSNSPLCQ